LLNSGQHGIDDRGDPYLRLDEIGDKQGPELLNQKIFTALCGPFRQLNEALDASEVDLTYHLGFAIDPGDLPDIVIGSSLFHFFVQVRH